jgi:hypothetical protein
MVLLFLSCFTIKNDGRGAVFKHTVAINYVFTFYYGVGVLYMNE